MKVAVCEDNKVMLDFISEKVDICLTSYGAFHEISKFENGRSFVSQHEQVIFDVVFLDIKLPDINGFEAAKLVKSTSPKTYIIFVTSESELVYESFDYQPFYFIPKNNIEFLVQKLSGVIGKLVDIFGERQIMCFDLPYKEKKYVDTEEIIYIESKSNYVNIICRNEVIHIRSKLDDIFKKLPIRSFVRIHNRTILNMHYLGRIDNGRCKAVLYNGIELNVSRLYKSDLIKKYTVFLRNYS